MAEPVRLDRYRERVEVQTSERPIIGRGLKPVYVIARNSREANSWARRNKPGYALKFCYSESVVPMRGLYLKDEPVYVLNPMPNDVRDAWLRTGARLVYL